MNCALCKEGGRETVQLEGFNMDWFYVSNVMVQMCLKQKTKKKVTAMGSFLILDVVTYIVVTNINLIISSVPRCSSLIRFCSVHFYKKRKTNVQTGRRIIKRVIANFSQ